MLSGHSLAWLNWRETDLSYFSEGDMTILKPQTFLLSVLFLSLPPPPIITDSHTPLQGAQCIVLGLSDPNTGVELDGSGKLQSPGLGYYEGTFSNGLEIPLQFLLLAQDNEIQPATRWELVREAMSFIFVLFLAIVLSII